MGSRARVSILVVGDSRIQTHMGVIDVSLTLRTILREPFMYLNQAQLWLHRSVKGNREQSMPCCILFSYAHTDTLKKAHWCSLTQRTRLGHEKDPSQECSAIRY